MKRIKVLKNISLLIAFLMFLSCLAVSALAMSEEEANAQKAEAEKQKKEAQYQVDLTQSSVDGIVAEMQKAETEMQRISYEIGKLDSRIGEINQALREAEIELDKAKQQIEKHRKEYGDRMSANYMMLDPQVVIDFLFSTENIGDFIAKVDMIVSIINADEAMLEQFEANMKAVVEKQTLIQNQKDELDAAKSTQESLLAGQKEIKEQLKQLYAENSAILDDYKAEVARQEQQIQAADQALAQIAAERQREAVANLNNGGGAGYVASSGYIWPTTSTAITSYFGYREQIDGLSVDTTYHNGLDIGAGLGSPIYATASGQVIFAGWGEAGTAAYGGGNCVMITHANGYTTLCAHMNSVAVSYGQYVNQGQIIGYVGATGWATGPHLHISFIDPNGNYQNPLNFLSY